jgi:hypothetical protein
LRQWQLAVCAEADQQAIEHAATPTTPVCKTPAAVETIVG